MATWGKIRKKLEQDYLCPSLRGRIKYFFTTYHTNEDRKLVIYLDGKEVLKTDNATYVMCSRDEYKQQCLKDDEYRHHDREEWHMIWSTIDKIVSDEKNFSPDMFCDAYFEYDTQSIDLSLKSENPIIRMLALLDRRVGKRRLVAMRDSMEQELDWVRFFYEVRMEAEGLQTVKE